MRTTRTAYAATQIAGRVLDIQPGYGVASVFNPTTQAPAPLIGTVLGVAPWFPGISN